MGIYTGQFAAVRSSYLQLPRVFSLLILLLISTFVRAQDFVKNNSVLTGVQSGAVGWADYDNDGLQDVLIAGSGSTKLYRQTTAGVFSVTSGVLPSGIPLPNNASVSWGDYDNDGNLDFILTGNNGSMFTKLYRQKITAGVRTFEDVTSVVFSAAVAVERASVKWGDYDNDGRLDILLTGLNGTTSYIRIYRQNGNGIFVDVTSAVTAGGTSLYGVAEGTADWIDFNNDGKLDFLITGRSGTSRYTRLYQQDGGKFKDVSATFLAAFATGISNSSTSWADYNGDGKPDLLLMGDNGSGTNYVKLLVQNAGGTAFDDKTSLIAGLSALKQGALSWVDYNNDGRLDFILTGMDNSSVRYTQLYQQDATGAFSKTTGVLPSDVPAVNNSFVQWADYDNDGKSDFIITGNASTGVVSVLYTNQGSFAANAKPSAPSSLSDVASYTTDGAIVNLSWAASSDDITPQKSLSYDIYVRNTATGALQTGPVADAATGQRRIVQSGSALATSTTISGLDPGTYAWGVQAVDGANAGSAFSAEKNFTLDYPKFVKKAGITLPGLESGMSAWGDYDNDGLADLLITGIAGNNTLKLYRQKTDGKFEDKSSLIYIHPGVSSGPGASRGSIKWGDYDNDGRLDFAFLGYNTTYAAATFFIYHQKTDGTFEIATGLSVNSSSSYQVNSPGIVSSPGYSQFTDGTLNRVDYDQDGRLDLYVNAYTSIPSAGYYTYLYHQKSDGTFESKSSLINGLVPGLQNASSEWIDYDKNGLPDLLITGYSNSLGYITKLIRQTSAGVFEDVTTKIPSVPGVFKGAVKWGDYDSDGLQDILLTGYNGSTRFFRLYHQIANGAFEDKTALVVNAANIGLTDANGSALSWGDYDNDGRLDFLITGNASSGRITRLYRQSASGSFEDMSAVSLPWDMPQGSFSGVDFADYNKDGRLDFFFSGIDNTGARQSFIYDNKGSSVVNTIPSVPSGLTQKVNDNGTVTLSWNPATDAETPSAGLTYNIYFGSAPATANRIPVSADISTGFGRIVQKGNLTATSFTIPVSLLDPAAPLYWSVQVDADYASSPFAAEKNFTMDYAKFVKKSATPFPAATYGATSWGDYDNDGLLDVLVTGSNGYGMLKLYRQKADGTFEDKTSLIAVPTEITTAYAGFYQGDIKWGDYDNDGLLDFAYIGYNSYYGNSYFMVYHQKTDGTFEVASGTAQRSGNSFYSYNGNINFSKMAIHSGALNWVDYDRDGRLDLFVDGLSSYNSGYYMYLIHQRPDGVFEDKSNLINSLVPTGQGVMADWADYDNNGFPDLLISGYNSSSGYFLRLIRQNSRGVFENVTSKILNSPPAMYMGGMKWGDYDNDGLLDFIMTGYNGSRIFRLYHQKTDGTFEDKSSLVADYANLGIADATGNGAVSWGDYDNDGRLDFIINGSNNSGRLARVYRQTATGTFTDVSSQVFPLDMPQFQSGRAEFVDFNNNGQLDFLIMGNGSPGGTQTLLYENKGSSIINTPPSAPSGLTQTLNTDGTVTFSWTASTDAQTPSSGLSYNLYLSSVSGKENKQSPASALSSGFRRIVQQGHSQTTSYTLPAEIFDPATSYYWSVQAIDGAYAGSPFAAEKSFTLDYNKFVKKAGTTFPAGTYGATSWGDYDNDGLLDVLVTGQNGYGVLKLYRQKADGTFEDKSALIPVPTEIGATNFGIYQGDIKWADYDNDGLLDFAYIGFNSYNTNSYFMVYHQKTDGTFEVASGIGQRTSSTFYNYPGIMNFSKMAVYNGTLNWVDYDHDGRMDLYLNGISSYNSSYYSYLIRQRPDRTFEDKSGIISSYAQAGQGVMADWADYDNNGLPDLLISGNNGSGYFFSLARQSSRGVFENATAKILNSPPALYMGGIKWGDYDSDGLQDFILTGTNGSRIFRLYHQKTDGTFEDKSSLVADYANIGVSDASGNGVIIMTAGLIS